MHVARRTVTVNVTYHNSIKFSNCTLYSRSCTYQLQVRFTTRLQIIVEFHNFLFLKQLDTLFYVHATLPKEIKCNCRTSLDLLSFPCHLSPTNV
jgi:hypothetical protein